MQEEELNLATQAVYEHLYIYISFFCIYLYFYFQYLSTFKIKKYFSYLSTINIT